MANKAQQPRSFNTIRRTQTKERAKRNRMSRVVLLAIFAVAALLVLQLLVLGICSVVHAISNAVNEPNGPSTSGGNNLFPSNVRYDDQVTRVYEDTYRGELILVNQDHKYQLFDYENGNTLKPGVLTLVNMYEKRSKPGGVFPYQVSQSEQMELSAFEAFDKMMCEYLRISGNQAINIALNDAYRSYNAQSGKSAQPGYSDHHTGYCVALGIPLTSPYEGISDSDPTYAWIFNNAHKYGFVVRYPDEKSSITGVKPGYEYCFRYVGVAHATYIYQNGLCLEEYIARLQSYHRFGSPLQINGADGNKYEVYYVPASTDSELTQFRVPSNYTYTISGDNDGGFIVTVNLSEPKA